MLTDLSAGPSVDVKDLPRAQVDGIEYGADGKKRIRLIDAPPPRNANYRIVNMLHDARREKVAASLGLHSQDGTKKETRNALPEREQEAVASAVDVTSAHRRKLKRAYDEEMYIRGIPESNFKAVDDRKLQGIDRRSVRDRYDGGRFRLVPQTAVTAEAASLGVADRVAETGRLMGPERASREGVRTKRTKFPLVETVDGRSLQHSEPRSDTLVRESTFDRRYRRNAPIHNRATAAERLREGGAVQRKVDDRIRTNSDVYSTPINMNEWTSDLTVGDSIRSAVFDKRTTASTDYGATGERAVNRVLDVEKSRAFDGVQDRKQMVKPSDSYGVERKLRAYDIENLPTHGHVHRGVNDRVDNRLPELPEVDRVLHGNRGQDGLDAREVFDGLDDRVRKNRFDLPTGEEALSRARFERRATDGRVRVKTYFAHGSIEPASDTRMATWTSFEREGCQGGRDDRGPDWRTLTDVVSGRDVERRLSPPERTTMGYGL